MKECQLYEEGFCSCYQMMCEDIQDCAPKIITKRNLETVKNIIDGK